jgi:hypothetical protein
MAQYNDVKTSKIALVGVLGSIIVVILVVLLQVIYYHAVAVQFQEKDVDVPLVELQRTVSAQQAKLLQYHWVDQGKGVVAIPIDRAMEIVVREGGKGHAKL